MLELFFGVILPWLLVVTGGYLVYQLILQNGRILLRLEGLEQRLTQLAAPSAPPAPPGLAPGTEAPAFTLPTLMGERHSLADYPGRRLLIFFNPHCGYCMQMGEALAALPTDGKDGRPLPVLVTSGELELNRRTAHDFGWRGPVLLQEKMEVAAAYRVEGTPIGYLIDADGLIASERTVGAEALLALAGSGPAGQPCGCGKPCRCQQADAAASATAGKANKGLAASRLVRDGLKAGTLAPAFHLPRLDGGALALETYRGRRVLLVFSDPQCGPCDALAPRLETLHRSRTDLAVVMVSRREPELNRHKADALGLTFPIALQKQWEISKLYGMFATPIGYLIDAQGVLQADVAVGVDPILALADLDPSANGKPQPVLAGAAGL